MDFIKKHYITILIISIISCGLFLRFYNLGKFSYWTDEFHHAIAAKSMISEGKPLVPVQPINGEYKRALLYTQLVKISFQIFGINEFAARLPSLVSNLLFIAIAFFCVRSIFGLPTALIFIFVMLFSPHEIKFARECRMYSIFQLLYFLLSFLFLYGFERSNGGGVVFSTFEKKHELSFIILLTCLPIGLLSLHLHPITYNFGFVILFFSICMVFVSIWLNSNITLKYWFVLFAFLIICILVFFIKPEMYRSFWYVTRQIPAWSNSTGKDYFFYRYLLSDQYPFFFFLYGIGAFMIIKDHRAKGLFIVISFVIPLLLHSFFYVRKLDRYIFYVIPFFFIPPAFAASILLQPLVPVFKKYFLKNRFLNIVFIFCLLFGFNVICYPFLGNSKNLIKSTNFPDYKLLSTEMIEELRNNTLFTTRPFPVYFYINRFPNVFIGVFNEDGSPFKKSLGEEEIVYDLETLTDAINKYPKPIYFLFDKWSYNNTAKISKNMKTMIETRAKKVENIVTEKIIIYRME